MSIKLVEASSKLVVKKARVSSYQTLFNTPRVAQRTALIAIVYYAQLLT